MPHGLTGSMAAFVSGLGLHVVAEEPMAPIADLSGAPGFIETLSKHLDIGGL